MGRLIALEELSALRDRHPDRRVVHCHGVFDLLHYGHLLHLRSAKRLGDLLVVSITADSFVNKGPGRPRFSDVQRATMTAALEDVDFVVINQSPTAVPVIEVLRPHIYAKGPDYAATLPPELIAERTAVERHGGSIVFTDDATDSSTNLLNSFLSNWDSRQIAALDKLRSLFSVPQIVEIIHRAAGLKVLVIGEPTIDTYIFCDVNGTTNKTPTLSVTANTMENHAGGALAIANHLAALGCDVTALVPHGDEPYYHETLARSMLGGVRIEEVAVARFLTPRKTRYVVPFQMNKLFQVVDVNHEPPADADVDGYFCRLEALAPAAELIVVADYGFGLFEEAGLARLASTDRFIALNTQTNSTNFGFNLFTKHRRFDYLTLNEREFRLGIGRRYGSVEQLMREGTRIEAPYCVTVGAKGSYSRDLDGEINFCPGFFSDIVDTVGAGDAFFSITAALARNQVTGLVVPFLGNCFAGLQSRTVGNSAPVAKGDLIRTLTALLS
jgi:rfaE bifunctional protein nucleotidyltransferase chain/domain